MTTNSFGFTDRPWQWWNRYGWGKGVDGALHAGARETHDWDDGCEIVLNATGYEADGVAASEGDARLVAAAPDLFDALYPFVMHDDDDIVHELDGGEPNTVLIRVTDDEYRAAQAALKKATDARG